MKKVVLIASIVLAHLSSAGQYTHDQLKKMADDDLHYWLYENGELDSLKSRIVDGDEINWESLPRFKSENFAKWHDLSGEDETAYRYEFIQEFMSKTESLRDE